MNACEALQIAKLNLRPYRGKSVAHQTRLHLERMRAERKQMHTPFALVDAENRRLTYGNCTTLRKAVFEKLRAKLLYGIDMIVCDSRTLIQLA